MRRSDIPRRTILLGDALTRLRDLPARSVDCVVTSPPYFLLRNYAVEGQLGAEADIDQWVDNLAAVATELARVLKPTGGFWLNLGDSYSRHPRYGAAPKSLLLGPERLLLRLSADGWVVRNKVVWAKPNPMPTSVRDRLTCSWEPIYFLVRSRQYFFDLDAVREAHASRQRPRRRATSPEKYGGGSPSWAGPLAGANDGLIRAHAEGRVGHRFGKNPGDVWHIAKGRFRGAHFATFPAKLLTRPILTTCPERTCAECGMPWQRLEGPLQAMCPCEGAWEAGILLDPFFGAGTTALEAERLGRDWVGIELNPEYRDLAMQRIEDAREHKGVRANNERSNT